MCAVSKTFLLTIMMVYTGGTASDCPEDCFCQSQIIHCQRNVLKEAIPVGIIEANLSDFQPEPVGKLSKVHKTWASVIKLKITLKFPSRIMYLADTCFEGLMSLNYLGIHGMSPKGPSPDFILYSETFYGLNNLKTLDLSGNSYLHLTEVTKSLTKADILPNLEVINLKDMQTFSHKPIYKAETQGLLKALQTRSIKKIVLDGAEFEIDFSYMNNLCKTVKVISMKSSILFGLFKADNLSCSSLRELDMTNASVPLMRLILKMPIRPDSNFAKRFNRFVSYIFSVETLRLNSFLLQEPKPLSFDNGWIVNTTGINWKVKYLYFSNNFLKNFNVSFRHMPFPKGTEIDVSNNHIEYINPKSIDPGKNIRKINLATNKLYKMGRDYSAHFAIFLHIFTDLEDINLSRNEIVSLPRNFFSNNLILKIINLSGNMIHALSFDMQLLAGLQYLDVSENRITRLASSQMIELETHASDFDNSGQNRSFVLNILRNNFTCDCEGLSFVKWMKTSTFLKGTHNQFFCTYDNRKYDMKIDALKQIEHVCKTKMLKRHLIIGFSVFFFLVFVTLLLVLLFKRYRKKQNKIKSYISYLRKKDENHFLAFLSFCSEDTEFVMSHLAHRLNDEICIRTKKKADYICIGDKHFRPGFPVVTEIMSNMENSAVAIFVISKTFCDRSWCHIEVKEAMDLQKPIVLIFREQVDEEDMPKLVKRLFRQNTRCNFAQGPDGDWKIQPSLDVLMSSVIELAAEAENIVLKLQ